MSPLHDPLSPQPAKMGEDPEKKGFSPSPRKGKPFRDGHPCDFAFTKWVGLSSPRCYCQSKGGECRGEKPFEAMGERDVQEIEQERDWRDGHNNSGEEISAEYRVSENKKRSGDVLFKGEKEGKKEEKRKIRPFFLLGWVVIGLIRFYQRFLSPLKKPSCRYYPTCSQYTLLSIKKYGVFRGLGKGMLRVMRCHPWSRGGYDPP